MRLVSRSLMLVLVLVLWLTVNDGGLLWLSERRCRWCPSMPVVPADAGGARRCRWCPPMPVVPADAGGARQCRCYPSMPVVPVIEWCPVVLCSWTTRV
ncbi:hypothetical protein HanOQP8_Chr02g0050381 [Helianthus annuus]|nr:hypothetical protein HanOQP8_Chr02g0050381 [Helianthus annuus]